MRWEAEEGILAGSKSVQISGMSATEVVIEVGDDRGVFVQREMSNSIEGPLKKGILLNHSARSGVGYRICESWGKSRYGTRRIHGI